jgi:hypothetical protein
MGTNYRIKVKTLANPTFSKSEYNLTYKMKWKKSKSTIYLTRGLNYWLFGRKGPSVLNLKGTFYKSRYLW